MKKVFSFSLFGSAEKYTKGLFKNIELINQYYPDWFIYVSIGDSVSEETLLLLNDKKNVKLISTNETGLVNKFYRFFSIDDPDVEIICVRDADSRVNARDRACIEDFLVSDKQFHIIRDHPNHHHTIMAGMWGIKKGILTRNLYHIFQSWKQMNSSINFWNDTDFVKSVFYPTILPVTMIHDETQHFEPQEWHTPFRVPLDDAKQHFIGQVYEFDTDGKEYPKYPYEKGE